MTKTFLEQKFERKVIRHIWNSQLGEEEKMNLIVRFHDKAEDFYDNLCDALYAISTGQNMKPVWITDGGDCYLSLYSRSAGDRILVYPDEVPPFQLDLIDQLEVAIQKI